MSPGRRAGRCSASASLKAWGERQGRVWDGPGPQASRECRLGWPADPPGLWARALALRDSAAARPPLPGSLSSPCK